MSTESNEPLDLNLLRVFVAVHEAGSVSRAAEHLGMTQPSVSYSLGRLRAAFDDMLFVRNGRGMAPTPLAHQLYAQLRDALTTVDNALESTQSFDAARSHRTFRVAMSDVGAICLALPLQKRIRELAPDIVLEVAQVPVDDVIDELASGKLDLAMGNLPLLHSAVRSELLFPERYVCVLSVDHPRIGTAVNVEQFVAERHIAVVSPYSLHRHIEEQLVERGVRRRPALMLPHYGILPAVMSGTDYLATLPSRLGAYFQSLGDSRCIELPVSLPSFEVRCVWHARQQNNPANIWLRTLAIETLNTL